MPASISRRHHLDDMNGYFIAASITTAQMRPMKTGRAQTASQLDVQSGRNTFVACADTLDEAQKLFDTGVTTLREGENPVETRVHETMAAQLVGELLTEQGTVPLDWPQIARQTVADVESTPVDYMEQGNWLDDGTLNGVQGGIPNVDELGAALPEDTRTGLNWQANKQFFFLFSVLSPLPPPSEPVEELEEPVAEPEPDAASDSGMEETTGEFSFERYLENAHYPKLAPMETAVLVRARNSAVAAWLWKRYAADTRLAATQFQLEGWEGVTGVESDVKPDGN